MVDIQPSNIESDADRICCKYLDESDPVFTQEGVKEQLKGLGPDYFNLNIVDLFRGSGLYTSNPWVHDP